MRSRPVLYNVVIVTFYFALACGGSTPGDSTSPPISSAFRIDLTGPEETVLDVGQFGMFHTPDGRMSFRRANGELSLWFPCAVSTCFLHGPSNTQLVPLQSGGQITPTVLGPSGNSSDFDGDYAGITSVFPSVNGHDLIGVYHAEQHPCGNGAFLRAFGTARSTDGGHTWTRQGQIVSSAETAPAPGDCSFGVYGPGDPMVTLSADGKYWLAYFNDRVPNRADEIYLARAAVESDGAPGAWTRYSGGSFSSPLLGGRGDVVIHRGTPGPTTIYAATGSVSWNVFLGLYIAVVMSMDGFYYSTSTDGVTWSDAVLLLGEHSWNDATISPDTPVAAYPSLLSFDQDSDLTTSRTGYLYYARSPKSNNPPHHMVRRPFAITRLP